MTFPRIPLLFRPYIARELPGWGRLYHWLGIRDIDNQSGRWRHAPTRVIRGKNHGYLMTLHLSDDIERATWFLGRYYDLEIQLLLDQLLAPGDAFVDVGANLGMTTLHAARRVGPTGVVYAFEPHLGCCERLRQNLARNGIAHVILHACGLGERDAELTLHVLGSSTVLSTLVVDPDHESAAVRETIPVPVRVGDQMLESASLGPLTVKIDVEGFELFVLRGLTRTIENERPHVVTEMDPRYLRRAGTDPAALFEFFADREYAGYAISYLRHGLVDAVRLRALASPADLRGENDVLWLAREQRRFDPVPNLRAR